MGAQAEKNIAVSEIADKMKRAQGMFLVDFTGLNVEEDKVLRRQLRALGVEYNVVKNRLAIRATKELDFPVDEALFRLPTGIIFSYDEPLTPAKTLVDYGKKLKDRLPIKAAVIEGQTYLADDAKRFASVPGKQELLSKVVGSLQSPVSGLVGTMQALVRELVGVLDAVKDKRQAEEDA